MVPTPAGLQLFELLRGAAPALVDPGTTAVWEMRLDDVVLGKANFRAVIDEIAGEAERLISVLRQHSGGTVDLNHPAPGRAKRGRLKVSRKARTDGPVATRAGAERTKNRRPRRAKIASQQPQGDRRQDPSGKPGRPSSAHSTAPTSRMVAFAERLAKDKRAALPTGYDEDFEICRRFLDQYAGH